MIKGTEGRFEYGVERGGEDPVTGKSPPGPVGSFTS